jgi:hypothetical protein
MRNVTERTLERHFAQLHRRGVLERAGFEKGKWGKRGSRSKVGLGRPPGHYRLGKMFDGYWIDDDLNFKSRRDRWIGLKFEISTREFRECLARSTLATLRVAEAVLPLLASMAKIPEMEEILKQATGKEKRTGNPSFPLLEEGIDYAVFRMRIPGGRAERESQPWE